VNAAGTRAYVAHLNGPMSVVDLVAGTTIATVAVPGTGAQTIALSPAGDRVYATNPDSNVYVFDTSTLTQVATIHTGRGPWGMAFRPTGSDTLVYVSLRDGRAIAEANARTGAVLRTFDLNGRPQGLALSPDGSTLYVADSGSAVVWSVSTTTGAYTGYLYVGYAVDVAISPDGQTLYVSSDEGVSVISTGTWTVTRVSRLGGSPRQIVTSESGDRAWAANENGFVDVVYR